MTDSLGKKTAYPELAPRAMTVSSDYINRYIGVDLEARQMADLLTKMQLASTVASDGARPPHLSPLPCRRPQRACTAAMPTQSLQTAAVWQQNMSNAPTPLGIQV